MNRIALVNGAALLFFLLAGRPARGQESVSRAEFDALKARYDRLEKEFDDFRQGRAQDEELAAEIEEITAKLKEVDGLARSVQPGTTRFLASGAASTTFTSRSGEESRFHAALELAFLWKLSDDLLVEAAIGGHTDVEVWYAQIDWLATDWLTLVAGKFLTPFNVFWERHRLPWINKLPSSPLVYPHPGAFVPESSIGVQARGAVPLGSDMSLNYAAWVADRTRVASWDGVGRLSEAASPEAPAIGEVVDLDDRKAWGARLSLLPIPELEVGGSVGYGDVEVDPLSGDEDEVLRAGAFLSYMRHVPFLAGDLDLKAEWIWTEADDRDGGYAQFSYRPSAAESGFLKHLELVFRFDRIDDPFGILPIGDRTRWTVGLDWWIRPTMVFKLAWEWDDPDRGRGQDALWAQVAVGF